MDTDGVPLSWEVVEIGEELARFPPFEGPPVLGRASLLRLSGDAMLVAEGADGLVHRFGLGGTHLGSFGRKGSGPGEFQRIMDLRALPDGSVWLTDWENSRWTRLGAEGQVLEEHLAQRLLTRFHPLSDGSLLLPALDRAGTLHRVAGPDSVFRVPAIEATLPVDGPPARGEPVFTRPESLTAEMRAQADAIFRRGTSLFLTGVGPWEDRGILVLSGTPARTLGYAVETGDPLGGEAQGKRPQVTRLAWPPDRTRVSPVQDLHLRGDTLFLLTSTDVRLFRVSLP